jgi:hypothetical protein
LSEIGDPRPFYEVDFLVISTSTAAPEFFNTILSILVIDSAALPGEPMTASCQAP